MQVVYYNVSVGTPWSRGAIAWVAIYIYLTVVTTWKLGTGAWVVIVVYNM